MFPIISRYFQMFPDISNYWAKIKNRKKKTVTFPNISILETFGNKIIG